MYEFSQDQLHELYQTAPSIDSHRLAQMLSCASTLITQESASIGLPDFPLDNLSKAAALLDAVSIQDAIKSGKILLQLLMCSRFRIIRFLTFFLVCIRIPCC